MNTKLSLLVAVTLAGLASSADAQIFRGQRFQFRPAPVVQFQTFHSRAPRFFRQSCPQLYVVPQCQSQIYQQQSLVQFRMGNENRGLSKSISRPTLAGQAGQTNFKSNSSSGDVPEIEAGNKRAVIDALVQPVNLESDDVPMIEELIVDPEVTPAGNIQLVDPLVADPEAKIENSVLEKDQ